MPIYRVQGPDGKIYRIEGPEGATAEQLGNFITGQTSNRPLMPNDPQPEGKLDKFLGEVKAGVASAPINAYLGTKQMISGLSPVEKDVLQQNRWAQAKAPVSAVAGNALSMVPTAFIPGANTLTGSAALGAATGAMQPISENESRLANALIGGTLGFGGQYIGNKLANAASSNLDKKQTAAEIANALNAPKIEALQAGKEAGYVLPPSAVNPSWINKRLESIAGKAATSQEASIRNQEVTNALSRKALGLPEDAPISSTLLADTRKQAGKPYQEVSDLSLIAKRDLEDLKQARFDTNAYFKHYNRSADPASLAKAKESRELVDLLEESIANEAKSAGKDELIPALSAARKNIAQTYTIERGLNSSSGDVSAQALGAMLKKGVPLSDELQTIAKFQQSFPQYVKEGAKVPTPGVSKSEALAASILGPLGAISTGSPLGAAAAALPLVSGPTRSMILSKPYQAMMANIPEQTAPASARLAELLLNNKIGRSAIPALSAQRVFGAEPVLEQ